MNNLALAPVLPQQSSNTCAHKCRCEKEGGRERERERERERGKGGGEKFRMKK